MPCVLVSTKDARHTILDANREVLVSMSDWTRRTGVIESGLDRQVIGLKETPPKSLRATERQPSEHQAPTCSTHQCVRTSGALASTFTSLLSQLDCCLEEENGDDLPSTSGLTLPGSRPSLFANLSAYPTLTTSLGILGQTWDITSSHGSCQNAHSHCSARFLRDSPYSRDRRLVHPLCVWQSQPSH